jgi:hypothetical protein
MYYAAVAAAVKTAAAYLKQRGPSAPERNEVLVLDVDGTALNWRAPRLGWQPPALAPVLALYKQARGLGYGIVFLTGRIATAETLTVTQLRQSGYAGVGHTLEAGGDLLLCRPDTTVTMAAWKRSVGAILVAHAVTVVLAMGDQPPDLLAAAECRVLLPTGEPSLGPW